MRVRSFVPKRTFPGTGRLLRGIFSGKTRNPFRTPQRSRGDQGFVKTRPCRSTPMPSTATRRVVVGKEIGPETRQRGSVAKGRRPPEKSNPCEQSVGKMLKGGQCLLEVRASAPWGGGDRSDHPLSKIQKGSHQSRCTPRARVHRVKVRRCARFQGIQESSPRRLHVAVYRGRRNRCLLPQQGTPRPNAQKCGVFRERLPLNGQSCPHSIKRRGHRRLLAAGQSTSAMTEEMETSRTKKYMFSPIGAIPNVAEFAFTG